MLKSDSQRIVCKHVLIWWRDLSDGLRYLHGKGIMHGDLKLENVLLFDNCRTAKISDLGHSKDLRHSTNAKVDDLPHGPAELREGNFF